MTPTEGAYGTPITISGEGLGSADRANVFVVIGGDSGVTLTPDDEAVLQWSETEIVFRPPFPAEGTVSIETPQGTATAGEFRATWASVWQQSLAPGARLIASVSGQAGHVAMLFDTTPAQLVHAATGDTTVEDVDLSGVVSSSIKLYVAANGAVEAIAISDAAQPELVHFARSGDGLSAEPTGILLESTEHALAGGPDGAVAWMHRQGGWARARPTGGGWAIDRTGVADVHPTASDRAAGATSDGALYVARSDDTGNFFDDMQAPFINRLGPEEDAFAPSVQAGANTDDYLTSLALDSRGRGLVVRYCGSDVDPLNLSSTGFRCFTGGLSTDGVLVRRVPNEGASVRHAFANRTHLQVACDDEGVLRLGTDVETDPGEPVSWPCPSIVAAEVDADGEFLPVVAVGSQLHLLRPRSAAP
jgi:hypothetical protein